MNWKGCGKKQSWSNWSIIQAFLWRKKEKYGRKLRITDIPV
jgi:hypothetical protein